MSDDTHDATEQSLFDTSETEVATDATDTDGTTEEVETPTEGSDTEQAQEGLKLDEPDKAPVNKAEEKKLDMIRKWQKDIDDGKKTVKDLPDAQAWLKGFLKDKDSDTKLPTDIAKEVAEQVVKETQEREDFKRLMNTLEDMATLDQKKLINEKYKLLREKGLSRIDALETASELAKVDMNGVSEKRRRMAIPQPSTNFDPKTADIESMPFEEAVKIFPKEKVAEHLRSLVR